MLKIKEEIQILLLKNGTSMKKVVNSTQGTHRDIPSPSTISTLLNNERIRFQTVQDILDVLGYELIIREKRN